MKTLIFLRHGEAESFYEAVSDHSRKLTNRGLIQTEEIGLKMKEKSPTPEIVFSSDSSRTRETWSQIEKTLGALPISFHSNLYLSDKDKIFDHLFSLGSDISTVLFIGHNPTWSSVVSELTGIAISMSPSDCAVIQNDSFRNWNEMPFLGGWGLSQKLKSDL